MIKISFENDYELTGFITLFESYMFATSEKHINKFLSLENCEAVIINGRSVDIYPMKDLKVRKEILKTFNNIASEKLSKPLNPKSYSCILLDIIDDEDIYDDKKINGTYIGIRNVLMDFCEKNNRIAVLVKHFDQKDRFPHVHILLERETRKHNEFQDYLSEFLK